MKRVITAVAIAGLLAGVTGGVGTASDRRHSGGFDGAAIAVPDDHPTIQQAVDAADPGDLILIAPGVYHESVNVVTDGLTIRGVDRNEVVLDGEFELDNGIRFLGATGAAVENLTVRNYTRNGVFWVEADGYRGSYLTALRNVDYGIYAFDSVNGIIEHSYAAGSPDAGFYIGQCFPCNALIDNVHAEHNGLGYSGTNSGGDLFIVNSRFNNNRVGVVPNSGSYELCYPERETTIVGNLVYANNQPDTPAIDVAILAMGNGILVAGGNRNTIARNRVWDHDKTGVGLVPLLEENALDEIPPEEQWDAPCAETRELPVASEPPAVLLWDSHQNEVTGNVLVDNRVADLAVGTLSPEPAALVNCFGGNEHATTAPTGLETLAPCDGDPATDGDWTAEALDIVSWLEDAENAPPNVDYAAAELPDPPALESMPGAERAAPASMPGGPPDVDLDAIAVPDAPEP